MEYEITEDTHDSASCSEYESENEDTDENESENTDESQQSEFEINLETETIEYVNGSILEEYNEENPCILCGRGAFCELEFHLYPICLCGKAWYHPACTIKCLRVAYGASYFLPIICPYCYPKKKSK